MGKSVAKLRRQLQRAEARGDSEAVAAAKAALESRQEAAEAAKVEEDARIKAQKKRRHESNKEKMKQRKRIKKAELAASRPPPELPLTLLIGNLKRGIEVEESIRGLLEKHGITVYRVRVLGTGAKARVKVATEEDAIKGVSLHRRMLLGRPINIERGGPNSGTEDSAAALAEAQTAMAHRLLEAAGLERLESDDQLIRHLAYHNEETVKLALDYYCRAAQEGARNEAALISALLKKQAALEEEEEDGLKDGQELDADQNAGEAYNDEEHKAEDETRRGCPKDGQNTEQEGKEEKAQEEEENDSDEKEDDDDSEDSEDKDSKADTDDDDDDDDDDDSSEQEDDGE